ncbi:Slp family lipoprotein [Nitrosovibrio sp. Nv17]|uniref:Slp family lipoprotein n=1 Tax=Nitrosovibrio sp. Nv17 TaxID=1855339 RepID=UPI000908D9BD|nr:Slp family lipoprotein [Nitrosovibrio sp. Nv17]SFW11895.1 outer membrane lipoprotein [Nitrosovibrio sp. Nv17]
MRHYSLGVCLLLGACAGLPSGVKDIPVKNVSYGQVIQDPAAYRNTPVRWGGVIIDVENEDSFTLVQVLSYPLSYYGRPQLSRASEGRFVIRSDEFLDPAVYAKDKEITVAGTLQDDVERTIGKKVVRLPLLTSQAIHLWPTYQAGPYGYGYPGPWGYGFSPYMGYGFYGNPYSWGGYYRPYW